jgi:L-alanine-DL-glutamate epimerase-like enolase superfamily enzyme
MVDPVQVAIRDVAFFVRNAPMRMPFRFGSVTLTASAVIHVRMDVELANGRRATGWAADMLAPKWFDKDPSKSYEDNLNDLLDMARAAARVYRHAGRHPDSVFSIWQQGYEESMAWAEERGLNRLIASNGASLQERALIDAVGRALGLSYHQLLVSEVLAIDLGTIHQELKSVDLARIVSPEPLNAVSVRHTVGLIDPIRRADIAPEEELVDGLPQSLEAYIEEQGIHYFKIKIGGDAQSDFLRLAAIASLLEERCERPYYVTLDGNEQYGDMDALVGLLERVERECPSLYNALLYIEQPLDRSLSLAPELEPAIRAVSERKPMLIDESDEDVRAFRQAVDLGYLGVSSKACKGLIKALSNAALVGHLNAAGGHYFMSAEDLTNIPVVGLHQDLAHVAALGIDHVERNGHHYVRGLDHLSTGEQAQCRAVHRTLYRETGDLLSLAIEQGRIDIRSLQCPGLGSGDIVDVEAMVRLEDWKMDQLVEGNR